MPELYDRHDRLMTAMVHDRLDRLDRHCRLFIGGTRSIHSRL